MTLEGLRPFAASVPDSDLEDLHNRISHARWPDPGTRSGWQQGIPPAVVRDLCRHWVNSYDWRKVESRLNAVPQFTARLEGIGIHFLHARSRHPEAFPLILTHGWPGSILELLDLIGPLTNPELHGGTAADAFHVVIPSLPGYGFSEKPSEPGWGVERIARAWIRLMHGLGYSSYGAAGSDWGTSVSSMIGHLDRERVAGVHLIPPLAGPGPGEAGPLTPAERSALTDLRDRALTSSAYSEVHRTAPQTIGYALADSPVGLCAWMAEKMLSWAGPGGLSRDQVLDQVTLYWVTGTAASSARLYAESIDQVSAWIEGTDVTPVRVPVGASIFAAEVPRPSRRWASRRYPNIRYWAEHPVAGHFPALEAPGVLVKDLRTFFGLVRD